ncbi:23S rRNA (uracil(1939)-C(5))-methyltransferase RlmD [Marinomonas fungiae]|uniref:23S rRNA (uracil(1939)-C(5))-methyltransferase RlmD n=1 Tax=Marinomonas fungiae TaxID=1137284 RepID=A0A0K6IP67_9GAMM|nr:23S rRNA (uracil(1939)-C(5))-methyltransferase RlmD [Marinomonas fungiae]CUB04920.1 23S rRNA m(5)U-1939 methyltransferase [Marinomonas fungiae]
MKHRSNRRTRPSQDKPISSPIRTFTIENTTHEGHGVARENGKVTFVDGALAGEKVEARVIKEGRQFNQAITLKRLQDSPVRVAPPCPHFEQCGGCQLQHMSVAAQRDLKVDWLAGQFRRLALPDEMSRLEGKDFGYRRRARISVFVKNNQAQIGFRAKASNTIIDIEQCQVLEPMLQSVYQSLRAQLLGSNLVAKLGHIELLFDDQGVCVVLRQSRELIELDKQMLNQWADAQHVTLLWQAPEQKKVAIDAPRHYTIDNFTVNFHPQDFIQVNAEINRLMVDQAMAWLSLSKEDVVLDLFCGAGNFSLPLAKQAGRVLAVEAIESMVEMGQSNAAQAQLDNLEFLAADLTQPPPNQLKKAKITKALLDPPRSGAFEFLPTLVRLKPQQILYVSCNASTLARDAEFLVENGFRVVKVCMMDMFPHTSHVETMMLLQK